MIRKTKDGYKLVSKKTNAQGQHKNLGTYTSKQAAKHREAQVEYFKHIKK
jgi:hypothetical protein